MLIFKIHFDILYLVGNYVFCLRKRKANFPRGTETLLIHGPLLLAIFQTTFVIPGSLSTEKSSTNDSIGSEI